jgi:hypothetical protein
VYDFAALVADLREQGDVEAQNVMVVFPGALGQMDPFPTPAVEPVRLGVDVIVTTRSRVSGRPPPRCSCHAAKAGHG